MDPMIWRAERPQNQLFWTPSSFVTKLLPSLTPSCFEVTNEISLNKRESISGGFYAVETAVNQLEGQ